MSGQTVGYVRVSSSDQHLDRQRASVIEALGGTEPTRWFEDMASGGTTDRPALAALLAHVRKGDRAVVASMDRLARSVPALLSLVDGLVERGVEVIFLKEGQVFGPGAASSMSALAWSLGVCGRARSSASAKSREYGQRKPRASTRDGYDGSPKSRSRPSVDGSQTECRWRGLRVRSAARGPCFTTRSTVEVPIA